jgi:hypothetical protein
MSLFSGKVCKKVTTIVSMHSAFDLFHLGLFELLDLDR